LFYEGRTLFYEGRTLFPPASMQMPGQSKIVFIYQTLRFTEETLYADFRPWLVRCTAPIRGAPRSALQVLWFLIWP